MNNFRAFLCFTIVIGLLASCSKTDQIHYDILINDAKIVDGSGKPSFYGDIGIVGDTIVAVGDLLPNSATAVIDATSLVASPGFIDMHTHADDGFSNPDSSANLNYLLQGVTTVRTGSDGSGSHEILKTKAAWEANGMGTNAVMFAPFRTIRGEVMDDDQLRSPSEEELQQMKSLVRQAMEEGAWGFSTQLEYGGYETFVTTEEIIELTRPIAEYNGLYISHMRDEASKFLTAIDEILRINQETGVPVNITHIKATGRDNWGLMASAIERVKQARQQGIQITADQYPYLQGAPIDYITSLVDIPKSMTPLYALSLEIQESDLAQTNQAEQRKAFVAELQSALQDPVKREQLKQSTYEKRPEDPSFVARWGWQDFRIKVAVNNAHLLEKNIADLIDEENRDGFDIVADLILEEPDILFASASQSPEDMRLALAQDWVMVSSDGLSFAQTKPSDAPVRAHPRSFASQAIVLRRFVREEQLLTLEEAVRKMTSLPAQVLGMTDRGLIGEGQKADIAIFDPNTVKDNATYSDSRQYATGFQYVIVNGTIGVEQGEYTGANNGEVLLKPLEVKVH